MESKLTKAQAEQLIEQINPADASAKTQLNEIISRMDTSGPANYTHTVLYAGSSGNRRKQGAGPY